MRDSGMLILSSANDFQAPTAERHVSAPAFYG
jgi:hypothetical protein